MDFPDLGKMKEMMSKAGEMREQMERKLTETVAEASSGGGVVTARVNGRRDLLSLKIDPVVMGSNAGDIEMLQDLITAAVNEAGRQAVAQMQSSMEGLMGGLNLPGLT